MAIRVDGPDPTLCGEWGEDSLMHAVLVGLLREQQMLDLADAEEGLELRVDVTPDYVYVNVRAKVARKHKIPRHRAAA